MSKQRWLLYTGLASVLIAATAGLYTLSGFSMEQLVQCSTEDTEPVSTACRGYLKTFRLDGQSIAELQKGAGLDGVLNGEGSHRYAVAAWLLEHGLNVDGVNHYGVDGGEHLTPLQAAVHYNDVQRADFLLTHGADKNARDREGRDVLNLAEQLQVAYPLEDRSALLKLLGR